MALDTRELFARLIQCEAGGEGEYGMAAVATVVMNRANATEGEFSRVGNGGDVRAVITQPGQFTCMRESVGGSYNAQNVYNMRYTLSDSGLGDGRRQASGNRQRAFLLQSLQRRMSHLFPYTRGSHT